MRASSFLAKKGLQGKFQNRNMNGNNKVFQTREKMMKRYLDFPFLRGYDRSWRVSAPTNKEKNYKDFILKFIRKLWKQQRLMRTTRTKLLPWASAGAVRQAGSGEPLRGRNTTAGWGGCSWLPARYRSTRDAREAEYPLPPQYLGRRGPETKQASNKTPARVISDVGTVSLPPPEMLPHSECTRG